MGTTLKIDLSDVLQFVKDASGAADLLQSELAETTLQASLAVQSLAVSDGYAPIDTGTLRSSIGPPSVSAGPKSVTGIVPVGAEYGIHVEVGTRFMQGRFYMARALRDRLQEIESSYRGMAERLLRKMGGGT